MSEADKFEFAEMAELSPGNEEAVEASPGKAECSAEWTESAVAAAEFSDMYVGAPVNGLYAPDRAAATAGLPIGS